MNTVFEDYAVTYGESGFPAKITQFLRNDRTADVVHTETPWLTVTLADGRVAMPQVDPNSPPLSYQSEDGAWHVHYNGIRFFAEGQSLGDWRLSLDYELFADGNVFLGMSFQVMDLVKPALSSFRLRIPMDFGEEDDVTYEHWGYRPAYFDPSGITNVDGFARNLTEKKPMTFDFTVPGLGFDFGRKGRPSRHIEWFMDDQTALDGDPTHVFTKLTWEAGSPVVEYEFAAAGMTDTPRPYYWRNKISLQLGQTPKIRAKAPMRFFHYLDEYEAMPTLAQIRKMAAEGCDVLNLHECWRSDHPNGGIPADQSRFRAVIEECHRHDIRVAPYIRGDGPSSQEDSCSWFHFYLKKNYDGLYSDYGSPFGYYVKDDNYRGGRFPFKQYYRNFKRIREQTIGPDGVLTIHAGGEFNNSVVAGLADVYLSGEGERGVMIRSRRENAFFSQSTGAAGALWTGAFPAYRTYRALPFLANIGQTPFVMLGEQWKSCALALSKEPGNATFARPLWKLYGLMKNERQLRFDNDLCDETLVCDSDDTGVSRFTMQDGSVLYLLSNFADHTRRCTTNQTLCCAEGQKCYRMDVSYEGASAVALSSGDKVEADLPAYGICGFLICACNEKWTGRLAIFNAPYPAKDEADLAYEARVAQARIDRFAPKPVKTLYLKVDMPVYTGTLENAFWKDVYDNYYQLFAIDENGVRTALGYPGKSGLTAEATPMADRLWAGQETPWIALHPLVAPGKYTFELHGCGQFGGDAHCHVHALAAETPDGANARDITYFGELDEDRTRLTFAAELI